MLTENQSKNVIWVTVSDRKDLSPMLKAYRAFQALLTQLWGFTAHLLYQSVAAGASFFSKQISIKPSVC